MQVGPLTEFETELEQNWNRIETEFKRNFETELKQNEARTRAKQQRNKNKTRSKQERKLQHKHEPTPKFQRYTSFTQQDHNRFTRIQLLL